MSDKIKITAAPIDPTSLLDPTAPFMPVNDPVDFLDPARSADFCVLPISSDTIIFDLPAAQNLREGLKIAFWEHGSIVVRWIHGDIWMHVGVAGPCVFTVVRLPEFPSRLTWQGLMNKEKRELTR